MIILETTRLVLRLFNSTDAAFANELLNSPGWLKHIGDRGIRNDEDAARWITERPLAAQQRDGFSFYVVTEKTSGNALGICGLVKRDALPLTDIGYAFLESAQGQGYAYEAATGVMRYAKEVLQMQELMAITSPENTASNQLLQKLGFRLQEEKILDGETELTRIYHIAFTNTEQH